MATAILKATRAIVDIGGISVQGLMMPGVTYRMSDSDITSAIDEPRNSLLRARRSGQLEQPEGKDFGCYKVRIEGNNSRLNASSIDLAVAYWILKAPTNKKALALIGALAAEPIYRRFDRAFGIKVAEAQYDATLALKLQSLEARHAWTDVIRDRMIQHGYYNDKIRVQAEFKALTVAVNLALFMQPHFCCDRDNMTPEQMQLIGDFERAAKRKALQMPNASPAELVNAALLNF